MENKRKKLSPKGDSKNANETALKTVKHTDSLNRFDNQNLRFETIRSPLSGLVKLLATENLWKMI